jgi:hypothetical protein
MASEAELKLKLTTLRRQEAKLLADLKAASRGTDLPPTAARPKTCTPWMRGVALRLLVLGDGDVEAPLKYLRAKGRTLEADQLRGWLADLPPAERQSLLDSPPGGGPESRQLAQAKKIMTEMQLASWVRGQNVGQGAAPTSSSILERAGPDFAKCKGRKNKHRWVRRCMQRWGGRRARFGFGERLSADEFRQKDSLASGSSRAWLALQSGCFRGRRFGTVFRSSNRGRRFDFVGAVSFPGPEIGLEIGPAARASWSSRLEPGQARGLALRRSAAGSGAASCRPAVTRVNPS